MIWARGAQAFGFRRDLAGKAARHHDNHVGGGFGEGFGPDSGAAIAFADMLLQMGIDQQRQRLGIEAAMHDERVERRPAPHMATRFGAIAAIAAAT